MMEWPLVLFTVAIQLSCGLAIAAAFADFRASRPILMRPVGMAIFPVAALGLLTSLLHLGQPFLAFRALRNLRSSRLSLEVVMTLLFVGVALVYSNAWRKDKIRGRAVLGVAVGILGLGAVVSSSLIYMLPSRPVWNSGWVPLSFLGTTLLLGGFGAATLLASKGEARLIRNLFAAAIGGGSLLMTSAIWMLSSLTRVPGNTFISIRLQHTMKLLGSPSYGLPFVLYLLLAVVVPVAFACGLWPHSEASMNGAGESLKFRWAFITIIAGVIIGRAVMYSLGLSTPPF